jgi:hypothetical protein
VRGDRDGRVESESGRRAERDVVNDSVPMQPDE